ncbi:MAG: DUF1553 domain-containing protein [Planctomycetaceae bacterium]
MKSQSSPTYRLSLSIACGMTLASVAGVLLCGSVTPSLQGEDAPPAQAEADKFFREQAEPILAKHCYSCHSAEAKSLKGDLRLDLPSGWKRGGESGEAAIIPGDAEKSPLIKAIRYDGLEMPPDKKLSYAEIAILTKWVTDGAKDNRADKPLTPAEDKSRWWSLEKLTRPAIPEVSSAPKNWQSHPVDRFLAKELAAKGLTPNAEADRRTLIRRATYDLTGLPPTPEQVAAFVADQDPAVYEKLIDRLLDSPQYGERWGRHWLDLVHFGESHGYDKDQPRPNAWPYRDYVIRSFNQDKPYTRFVQEQVAGDVLFPDTVDGMEALGFISAGPWDLIGHAEVPESKLDGKIARHLDRDDMVTTTISTFCSMTVHCAQCHNHKFDPIPQADYYALQSVFAALDRADKRYDADPAIGHKRKDLLVQLDKHRAQGNEIKAKVHAAAGPMLKEMEGRIAALQSNKPQQPVEFGWHSNLTNNENDVKWVQVDLGAPKLITSVVMNPCFDDFGGIGAGFGFPRRFQIEASDDPQFQGLVQVIKAAEETDYPAPGLKPQRFTMDGVSARYVRITATRLAHRTSDYMFALSELQVLGTDGVNLAKGAPVAALDSIEALPRWSQKNLTDGLYPRADASEELKVEREAMERLLVEKVPKDLRDAQTANLQLQSDVNAQLAALPPQQVVFAGTIHTGTGTFTGTGASGGKPRPIHVLSRGDIRRPGAEASPGTLSAVSALPSRFELPADAPESARRAALAQWLTHPDNPLLWRSVANRVWQYHFGQAIVETSNDFGRMGQLPSHPDLLNYLAITMRDDFGGSFKKMHRHLMLSSAYKQSSQSNPQAAAIDPENRLVWRMNRRKLEAEAVRDSILSVAGKLNPMVGGPSFKDFVVEHPEHSPHYEYELADADNPAFYRRSVYRFVVRSRQQPFLSVLDCADPSLLVEKRNQTITPLQALAQLNNQLVLVMSKHFAERLTKEAGNDPAAQVKRGVELTCLREPTAEELTALTAHVQKHGLPETCRVLLNLNEFVFVD